MSTIPDIRKVPEVGSLLSSLGPLSELPGLWEGTGFNLIARPDFAARSVPPSPTEPSHLFLELNFTTETLKFDTIGSSIPNRGFSQADIELFGVHYLQQISDRITGGALHLEPGIWVNVPVTTAPPETASVARMASIPHGTVMLAEGAATTIAGPPTIGPANTVPFGVNAPTPASGATNGFPEYDLAAPAPAPTFRTPASDVPGLTQEMINDPNSILRSAIEGQDIVETVQLNIATVSTFNVLDAPAPPPPAPQPGSTPVTIPDGGGGTQNIPFLLTNATSAQVLATFWIEKVRDGAAPGRHFMQLQYSQTVLLNFPLDIGGTPSTVNLSWPHVSVATLVKHF